MNSLAILREFFNALGIYRDPMKPSCAARYLADGGKIPQAVEDNIRGSNALMNHLRARELKAMG